MNKKKNRSLKDTEWARAKKLCRLNQDDIRMAKDLGFKPKSLIKNIPNKSEQWKAPVKEWIRDLYRKRFGKTLGDKTNSSKEQLEKPDTVFSHDEWPLKELVDDPFPYDDSIDLDDELLEDEFLDDSNPPGEKEIARENQQLLKRQREFRIAADYIANAYRQLPEVDKIVLFGSVAFPLEKEEPRFNPFRRHGIKLWHECRDVDIAVWVNDCNSLNKLRKIRSLQLNFLMYEQNIGVAHHQVEIFVMDSRIDRYLGRLCCFGTCPKKGKNECFVQGCGKPEFLKQIEDFTLYPDAFDPDKSIVLFDQSKEQLNMNVLDEELPF